MTRITLIEDDYETRKSIRNAFVESSKIEIEFETDSIEKTILYYRSRPAPNLILLDINLSGISGIDGLPVLHRHFPEVIIVIHSVVDDEDLIFQAICHGASGYLLKGTPLDELEKLLLITLNGGGSPISPPIARRILNYFSSGRHKAPRLQDAQFSEAERTIVKLLADGLTYQEISELLGLTIDGVRYHIKRIYSKLQLKSRSQLIRHFLDKPNSFS